MSCIMLVVSGIWQIYNFLSMMFNLPYIQLFSESVIFRSLNAIALKWSLPLGIVSIIVGLLGFVMKDDETVGKLRFALLAVSLFVSVCLIF